MSWDSLAKPKEYGGWGLKNIFYFGNALTTKSLWRSPFSKGQWSEVIKAKYMKNEDLVDWIRGENKGQRNISNC